MPRYDDTAERLRPRNVFEAHLARPVKRYLDSTRDRVSGLSVRTNSPAFLDQHPGKAVPFAFNLKYGPFGLVTARRNGAVGFEGRAPLVNLAGNFGAPGLGAGAASNFAQNQLPRDNNSGAFVNREGAFHWTGSQIVGPISVTYTADPGFPDPVVVDPRPVADIYDSVLRTNGGALSANYFFSSVAFQNKVIISGDLQMYDRKRARALHEDFLPFQVFAGQSFANKSQAPIARFDPNTEIEPRLRLLEVRIGDLLDTDQAFDAAQIAVYIDVTLLGRKVLEV